MSEILRKKFEEAHSAGKPYLVVLNEPADSGMTLCSRTNYYAIDDQSEIPHLLERARCVDKHMGLDFIDHLADVFDTAQSFEAQLEKGSEGRKAEFLSPDTLQVLATDKAGYIRAIQQKSWDALPFLDRIFSKRP